MRVWQHCHVSLTPPFYDKCRVQEKQNITLTAPSFPNLKPEKLRFPVMLCDTLHILRGKP